MRRNAGIFIFLFIFASLLHEASAETVSLKDLPPLPKEAQLTQAEKKFSFRGRIGGFRVEPSRYGSYLDKKVFYPEGQDQESIKYIYDRRDDKSFVGTYLVLIGDISKFKTLTFYIKGEKGGESFEIGLNDLISNKREDAVMAGSIYRYLPKGVTTEWQRVAIPLRDWFGPDFTRIHSLVFHFNEVGKGAFWIDEVACHTEQIVDREAEIEKEGRLLLDDFDHNDLNLLGRKTNTYKKLPSLCGSSRVTEGRWGDEGRPSASLRTALSDPPTIVGGESMGSTSSPSTLSKVEGSNGRSLKLDYKKEGTGWCGYYTLLNEVDGEFFDLSWYDKLSFRVKGGKGGEIFEIGMADRNWANIGDSVKAGPIDKYLPGGVTTEWQEVTIPLRDFGLLDFTQMGSFVINFHKKQEGTLYLDDLTFYLKQ